MAEEKVERIQHEKVVLRKRSKGYSMRRSCCGKVLISCALIAPGSCFLS